MNRNDGGNIEYKTSKPNSIFSQVVAMAKDSGKMVTCQCPYCDCQVTGELDGEICVRCQLGDHAD